MLILIAFTVAYNIIPFSLRLPGLKLVDGIGGGLLGAGQGLLLVFALTWALGYLGLPLEHFSENLIEQTRVTEFFISRNPLINFIDL